MIPEIFFLDSTHNTIEIPRGITALTHLGYNALDIADLDPAEKTSVIQVFSGGEHEKPFPMMPGQTIHWEKPTDEPIHVKYPTSEGRAMISVGKGTFVTHPQGSVLDAGGIVLPQNDLSGFNKKGVTIWALADWDGVTPANPITKHFIVAPPYGVGGGILTEVDRSTAAGELHLHRRSMPRATNIALFIRAHCTSGTGTYKIEMFERPGGAGGTPPVSLTLSTTNMSSGVWNRKSSTDAGLDRMYGRSISLVLTVPGPGSLVDPAFDMWAGIW